MITDIEPNGTAFACVVCNNVVVKFDKLNLPERQSPQALKRKILQFRTTTCNACRSAIIETPAEPRTGTILLPGRERPVALDAIANWICYKDLCDDLGRLPEIYQLGNWSVIENLFRLKDEMTDESVVLKYEVQADGTPVGDKNGIGFFISNKPRITKDSILENTDVDVLGNVCLGCVQCPAIFPLLHEQDQSDILFRLTTCQRCREATTARNLCQVGDVPLGLDFLESLPSFYAARKTLGMDMDMRFLKTQGYYTIESSYLLRQQYWDGTKDCGGFF